MAAPASTKSEFFAKYEGFQLKPQASVLDEFQRLAAQRQWKPGSKSRTYEKAWQKCIGVSVAPGQLVQLGGEMAVVLDGLERLNVSERPPTKISRRRVAAEFSLHYGYDSSKKEKWQDVCRDCGLSSIPTSITMCKKVV